MALTSLSALSLPHFPGKGYHLRVKYRLRREKGEGDKKTGNSFQEINRFPLCKIRKIR